MNLEKKTKQELVELLQTLEVLEKKQKYNKVATYFPDKGDHSRDKYPVHMEFMTAGNKHHIRAMVGGNGTGKSIWGSLEAYFHASGKYPKWWEGKRFEGPTKGWVCARENKQMRDSIQEILFGSYADQGTGMIPKEDILDDNGNLTTRAMSGTAGCVGTVAVRHYDKNGQFDGWSDIQFKTYAQGWQEFQGATRNWIWLDEEPDDPKIHSECLSRLRGPKGKEGILWCTFTPLLGYSTVYLTFLPNGQMPEDGISPTNPDQFVCVVGWDDVPHLSEDFKRSMIANWQATDPNSIEARTKGVAAMGSGRIYPIDEHFVVTPRMKIPTYWKKAYGIDPGWNNTAVIWIAQDPNTNIKYIYSEYKHGKVVYPIHAEAIKNRGDWIWGACDPHEAPKPRDDGTNTLDYLCGLGLNLIPARGEPNALRASILSQFQAGALKIVGEDCQELLNEIRIYRYDAHDPNKPARDQNDHLCDAMLYCLAKFDEIAASYCQIEEELYNLKRPSSNNESGRSSTTGY